MPECLKVGGLDIACLKTRSGSLNYLLFAVDHRWAKQEYLTNFGREFTATDMRNAQLNL